MNKISRWQFIQRCTQRIWKKLSRDYLHQLQQRHKWPPESNNIQRWTVVLIKDDHAQPLHWKLGVIDLHYVGDEIVRVADVRTKYGVFAEQCIKSAHYLLMQSNLFAWGLNVLLFLYFFICLEVK